MNSPGLGAIELKYPLSCHCAAISIEAKKGKEEREGGKKEAENIKRV